MSKLGTEVFRSEVEIDAAMKEFPFIAQFLAKVDRVDRFVLSQFDIPFLRVSAIQRKREAYYQSSMGPDWPGYKNKRVLLLGSQGDLVAEVKARQMRIYHDGSGSTRQSWKSGEPGGSFATVETTLRERNPERVYYGLVINSASWWSQTMQKERERYIEFSAMPKCEYRCSRWGCPHCNPENPEPPEHRVSVYLHWAAVDGSVAVLLRKFAGEARARIATLSHAMRENLQEAATL